jgi:hypothetical protein
MATKKPAVPRRAEKNKIPKKVSSSLPKASKKKTITNSKSSLSKAPGKKVSVLADSTISGKAISAEAIRKSISFFYLLSFWPPALLDQFIRVTQAMRDGLASESGMDSGAFFRHVVPEVSRRVVAFHQGTREPDPIYVDGLMAATLNADKNPDFLKAYQAKMAEIAMLPGRTKPENRLHRNKGCAYCATPCRYGFFTLVSEPKLSGLQELLASEAAKPAAEQSPLIPAYRFTFQHLAGLTNSSAGAIIIEHMANLSYCLLMLGMAKSRLSLPEKELQQFQSANQRFIQMTGEP